MKERGKDRNLTRDDFNVSRFDAPDLKIFIAQGGMSQSDKANTFNTDSNSTSILCQVVKEENEMKKKNKKLKMKNEGKTLKKFN